MHAWGVEQLSSSHDLVVVGHPLTSAPQRLHSRLRHSQVLSWFWCSSSGTLVPHHVHIFGRMRPGAGRRWDTAPSPVTQPT